MNEEAYRTALAKDAREHRMGSKFGFRASGPGRKPASDSEVMAEILNVLGDNSLTETYVHRKIGRDGYRVSALIQAMAREGILEKSIGTVNGREYVYYRVVK